MNTEMTYILCFLILAVRASESSSSGLESSLDIEGSSAIREILVREWLKTIASATNEQHDTSALISDINNSLNKNILVNTEDGIRIEYRNVIDLIKLRGREILSKALDSKDFFLNIFSQKALDTFLDNFFSNFQQVIEAANFSSKIQTRTLQSYSTRSSLTEILQQTFVDLLILLLKPLQVLVNQTLVSAVGLMTYYQPVEPSGFFDSVLTSIINQSILLVVEFLDLQRTAINNIFVSTNQTETKTLHGLSQSEDNEPILTRSIIDVVVAPLSFLARIIFTPLRTIVVVIANFVFAVLRPILGTSILGIIESVAWRIIGLIP